MDWDAFSAVVGQARYPWLSSDSERIERVLGADALALVGVMRDFADRQHDLWRSTLSWIEVQPELARRLRSEFPNLSDEAARRIALGAAYSWK